MAEDLGLGKVVSFPGFSANPYPILSQASALVLSSRWEGFGLVLVEALACGCPVISTDCRSGPREILDGGRFGTLVPVGDPDALARAMEMRNSAGSDPSQLRKRAEAFRVESVAERYLEVLKRAASLARESRRD
jgi:glycosyltransferase involved in cell wall biosynthesis